MLVLETPTRLLKLYGSHHRLVQKIRLHKIEHQMRRTKTQLNLKIMKKKAPKFLKFGLLLQNI